MNQLEEKDRLSLGPKKFNMWLFLLTSFMLFAALTSGFIVYAGGSASRGLNITLPNAFIYSTAVIVISSITMHVGFLSAKRLKFGRQRLFLFITLLLGISFFCIQVYGWGQLVQMGVNFINANASQSFIYVFTGLHLVHIIAALVLLVFCILGSYRNIAQVRNIFRMEMAALFWHFLDILWIYLYVFLLLNQS